MIHPQPKPKREVSESRLKWARRQPCIIAYAHGCTGMPIDAHHIIAKGAGGSDFTTLPLCRAAHQLYHSKGRREFEHYFGLDLCELIQEHNARYQAEVKPRPKKQREVKTVKTFAQCPNRCKSLHPIRVGVFWCPRVRKHIEVA